MSIYHCSVTTISRSKGRSATAASAYRSASLVVDVRTGLTFDYTKKKGVESAVLVYPKDSKEVDRNTIWNQIETRENRRNSTVAREIKIALPDELSSQKREALAVEYTKSLVDRYGVVADVAIHSPHRQGDQRNHHAHILMSTRRYENDQFTEKTRELDDIKRGKEEVMWIREQWATVANKQLEKENVKERIDHRSFKDQGVEKLPTIHLGSSAMAMERKGIRTELGDHNREIEKFNQALGNTKEISLSSTEGFDRGLSLDEVNKLEKQYQKELEDLSQDKNLPDDYRLSQLNQEIGVIENQLKELEPDYLEYKTLREKAEKQARDRLEKTQKKVNQQIQETQKKIDALDKKRDSIKPNRMERLFKGKQIEQNRQVLEKQRMKLFERLDTLNGRRVALKRYKSGLLVEHNLEKRIDKTVKGLNLNIFERGKSYLEKQHKLGIKNTFKYARIRSLKQGISKGLGLEM